MEDVERRPRHALALAMPVISKGRVARQRAQPQTNINHGVVIAAQWLEQCIERLADCGVVARREEVETTHKETQSIANARLRLAIILGRRHQITNSLVPPANNCRVVEVICDELRLLDVFAFQSQPCPPLPCQQRIELILRKRVSDHHDTTAQRARRQPSQRAIKGFEFCWCTASAAIEACAMVIVSCPSFPCAGEWCELSLSGEAAWHLFIRGIFQLRYSAVFSFAARHE